uniref:Uncharacterized protein n=1 Tax=Nelumbo nucifera TaxID=4432 RepID=A0A822Y7G0_NELNU|nr:TPA_asm: hypothetical protein HUJ06_029908 [Nelumbo nucifera]
MTFILGVSFLYQIPLLEPSRRALSSVSLPSSDKLNQFGYLKSTSSKPIETTFYQRTRTCIVVPSAIFTPNSVLSEDAFKAPAADCQKGLSIEVKDNDVKYLKEFGARTCCRRLFAMSRARRR